MHKKILLLLLVFGYLQGYSQKYITKTGITNFKASVKAFEPVEAQNNSTTAILNTENGEIAALLFINTFKFKVALMQEHFNENYMESDIFPKAFFKGKISDFNIETLTEKPKKLNLKGILSIRNIEKKIITTIYIQKKKEQLILTSNFNINPEDFDIKIPSIVRKKISKTININFKYEIIKK